MRATRFLWLISRRLFFGWCLLLGATACAADVKDVKEIGRIAHPAITESSGIVASRQHKEVFWTHSDGNRPNLYAIKRDGSNVAEFRVTGAFFDDWEDIAIDREGQLYLADTGNNKGKRREATVYRIAEPNPAATDRSVAVNAKWVLRYLGEPVDSEGLFIWNGSGCLVSKVTNDRKAQIFRFALTNSMNAQTLELVTTVDVESPVTAADISPSGKHLAMVAKSGAFVFPIDGDVGKAGTIKPQRVKFRHDSMEGCCFVPGGLITCAESRQIYFFDEALFEQRFD